MTKEVFVQYKETLQRLKELHKELSVTHDKTIENELIQTDKIRFNLEKEYDWQDNIFDDENELFGVKDVMGHLLISPQWDDIYPTLSYQEHQYMPYTVCKDGKWGIMMADGKNQLLCELKYDSIDVVGDEEYGYREYFVICKDDKCGILDFKGKEILPCEMDNITPQIHESIIEHKGKFGMVTFNRRIIMPEYDIIEFDADNLMLPALKEGKWGLLNNTSGDFTVNESMNLSDPVGKLTICGITIEECKKENSISKQNICFRLTEPLKVLLKRVDRTEYPFLEDYVDKLLESRVTTSQSTTIPLAGNVIPSDRDAVDKDNLPTTNPLFCENLEDLQNRIATSKCFEKLFDWSTNESKKTMRPSWMEKVGDDTLIFPKNNGILNKAETTIQPQRFYV